MTKIGLAAIALVVSTSVGHAQGPGSAPQLPLSYPMWQRFQANPGALRQLQSQLPSVAIEQDRTQRTYRLRLP
jgi:hypothetical protein